MASNVQFEEDFEFVDGAAAPAAGAPEAEGASSATAAPAGAVSGDPVGELRRELSLLAARSEKRNATQDGRIRVLEAQLEDSESRIAEAGGAVQRVGRRVREEAAFGAVQMSAARKSLEETAVLARANASQLDRAVGKYLPEIEESVRAAEDMRKLQGAAFGAQIAEIHRRLEAVGPAEVAEIRRVAAEANLRSLLVERMVPEVRAAVIAAVREEARKNREAANRLGQVQFQVSEEVREAVSRLDLTDRLVHHLSGTVVRLLEARVQEHIELAAARTSRFEAVQRLAAEREAALLRRVDALEAAVDGAREAALENERLRERLSAVEAAVERLAAGARPTPAAEPRAGTLANEIAAEVEKRERRRRVPTARALRAEIIKRGLCSEIVRRRERAFGRLVVTSRSLRSEILRRALTAEIARREQLAASKTRPSLSGIVRVKCKTLSANVSVDVALPYFVSVAYLKQLIYFKSGCTLRPDEQTLVYAGNILQDGWKIGGGDYVPPGRRGLVSVGAGVYFKGIRSGSTVLVVIRK
ncbi:MAG: hypothetical protein BJ554DRAFT_868 [Olpidium bornovanus]|uniref:Ubiquitin-like domain-containing protein n=1 Tax=Olpidium bornovanus TaxID=278681 RepID=A0A8H7ZSW0_9FUNG|nr:MAG: hypothetical protein BJ554DRAFT_868 [Olpidium bornovanus]